VIFQPGRREKSALVFGKRAVLVIMKAILCIAVYLALVFALGVIMALPTPREGGLPEGGDDDL
jgi:hypothetical protein